MVDLTANVVSPMPEFDGKMLFRQLCKADVARSQDPVHSTNLVLAKLRDAALIIDYLVHAYSLPSEEGVLLSIYIKIDDGLVYRASSLPVRELTRETGMVMDVLYG